MKLKAILNEFIFDCTIKKYTPQTIKGYRNGNNLMINWLSDNYDITDIEEVKPVHLKGYINSKVERNLTDTYINGVIKQIRAFFKYAVECEYIAVNPALKVNWAKERKPIIKTFTDKEAKQLARAFTNNTYLEARNRTIITMLLDTGIRNNELCILKQDSITDDIITIFGKGNKERQVGVSPVLQKQLMIFMRIRQTYFSDKIVHNNTLFLSRTGRKCTIETIENILKEAGRRIAIDESIRCSPHTCRHYYAQSLVRNGIDVYSLSRLLGHENISITQRYLESMLDKDIVKRSIMTSPLMNI